MAKLRDAAGTRGLFTDGDWILSENMDKAGTVRVIQLKHVGVGEFLLKDFQFITEQTFRELRCTEVLPGDVLISRMADPIARACMVPRLPFRAVTAVDVSILRVDDRVADSRFVAHLCNSPVVRHQAESAGRGTTRSRITRTELEEVEIPLPSLPEQHRIAELLEQADWLRRTRYYALQLSTAFLPAAFREWFGDPQINQHAWQMHPLGEMALIRRGASPRPIEKFLGGTVPWIKISDGTKEDSIYITSTEDAVTPHGAAKSVRLKLGSLIFANCGVSLGFARILKIEGCIHDGWLALEKFEEHFHPIFLLQLINQLTFHFRRLAPEGTQPNLNTEIMGRFLVIVPPMPLQERFASLVERHERLRAGQREGLRQAEHLFQTLLHQAFASA